MVWSFLTDCRYALRYVQLGAEFSAPAAQSSTTHHVAPSSRISHVQSELHSCTPSNEHLALDSNAPFTDTGTDMKDRWEINSSAVTYPITSSSPEGATVSSPTATTATGIFSYGSSSNGFVSHIPSFASNYPDQRNFKWISELLSAFALQSSCQHKAALEKFNRLSAMFPSNVLLMLNKAHLQVSCRCRPR